ncbi:MAG: LysR family transcriptional regulator [Pseudomonadota bacterium]|nr:LysR family transcriptional regulator [Pseudomonadota bacterium]
MKLSDIDLNLFVVFNAIYTEGNLTRAGEIIGITQPAVSNSLSRLRTLFDDPLFVRTADGMIPTPVTQNIIGSVRQALDLFRSSIQESEHFDPLLSEKRFRISMSDLQQAVYLPSLLKNMKKQAPHTAAECYQVRRRDLNIELASGNLDLGFDVPLTPDPQIRHTQLRSIPQVCVVRKKHPLIKGPLTIEDYLSLEHLHISSRRGGLGIVDLALGKMGEKRNIVIRTQHYMSTAQLVVGSNLAVTVPLHFAEFLKNVVPIMLLPLPFEVPDLETHLYWHESTDKDQANQWLRKMITDQSAHTATHTD